MGLLCFFFLLAAEMDYNTDGQCSFKEFLYAYVGWVECRMKRRRRREVKSILVPIRRGGNPPSH